MHLYNFLLLYTIRNTIYTNLLYKAREASDMSEQERERERVASENMREKCTTNSLLWNTNKSKGR